jgi:hypothetical protein
LLFWCWPEETSSGAACPPHITPHLSQRCVYNFLERHKKVGSKLTATGDGVTYASETYP